MTLAEVTRDDDQPAQSCQARNTRGQPCGAPVVGGGAYCFWHDPQRVQERAAARKRGGYNRRQVRAATPSGPVRIRSAQDALTLIEQAISDVLALENSLTRARTVGYQAAVALKSVEVGEIEGRLLALEQEVQSE